MHDAEFLRIDFYSLVPFQDFDKELFFKIFEEKLWFNTLFVEKNMFNVKCFRKCGIFFSINFFNIELSSYF